MDQIMGDRELLTEYVNNGSTGAFAQLVKAHIDLVYAAARRQLRDSTTAEDVTQAVFILLAKKARSLPRDVILGGWLLNTTRYVCQNARRIEARRRNHETRAAQMASPTQSVSTGDDQMWTELRPQLDDALASLASKDRDAVVLRFFQDKSFADVGAAMGTSEEAARKRVARALQRLGENLRGAGVTVPAAALESLLISRCTETAPTALIHVAAQSALAGAGGSAASALAAGAIGMTVAAKSTIVAAAVMLIVGTTAVVAVKNSNASAPTTSPSVVATVPASPWTVTSDGATVELLAVSKQGANQWWKPDGTILVKPPFPPSKQGTVNGMPTPYRFLLRFSGLPNDANYSIRTSNSLGGSSSATGSKTEVTYTAQVISAGKTTDLLIALDTAKWSTILEDKTPDKSVEAALPTGDSITIEPVIRDEATRTATVKMTCGVLPDADYRVLLVVGGREIKSNSMSMNRSLLKDATIEYGFRPVPAGAIEAVRFVTRPHQWQTIKNISLVPGKSATTQP